MKYILKQFSQISILFFICVFSSGFSDYLGNNTKHSENSYKDLLTITVPGGKIQENPQTFEAKKNSDKSCWQLEPLNKGNKIRGGILFAYGTAGYYFWDVSSFHAKKFDYTGTEREDFSREYSSSYRKSILVRLSDKEVVSKSPESNLITYQIPKGNLEFIQLLNGNILVTPYGSQRFNQEFLDNVEKDGGYLDNYSIYDHNTGKLLQSHSVFLPKFKYFNEGNILYADKSYSPDGSKLIYRSSSPDGSDRYILFDLETQKVLWTLPATIKEMGKNDNHPYLPTWRPDGNSLSYISTTDDKKLYPNFFDISLDGSIKQITQLEEIITTGYTLSFNPQWSQDNHYMAFNVIKHDQPKESELYIWDDTQKIVFAPCLPNEGLDPLSSYSIDWSFDSEHILLIISNEGTYKNEYFHYILDIPDKTIYKLPNDENIKDYPGLSDKVSNYSYGYWMNWEVP